MITRLRMVVASHGYPLLISLIAALLIGGAYSIVEPIAYTVDSSGYLEGARWFAHYQGGKYPYWRTPLFMIMMALTGVAQGWTLKLLVVLQDLMAILIPLIIYFSLAWIRRSVACLISVAASISLIPFVNSGYIMPNHLYYFFVFLTVACSAYYFQSKKTRFTIRDGAALFCRRLDPPPRILFVLGFFCCDFSLPTHTLQLVRIYQ